MVKNQRTHVFGVPLRKSKFRRQVRIGAVTHSYNDYAYMKANTLCGIPYTHQEHRVNDARMLATRTSRDIDCMSCLVLKGRG